LLYLSGCYVEGMPFMASYGGQGNRAPLADIVWAADNGCFARPERYSDDGYLAWLDARPRNALFACAPDVVGDWLATLERSLPMLERIRHLKFKAALVLQDGAAPETVPWDECDAVFIGGSTAWKLGSGVPDLVREARAHEKWVHMGRVNSESRLIAARAIGCDSADGNYVAFGPDINAPKVRAWIERLLRQPTLRPA
jgi:hypothetical protein